MTNFKKIDTYIEKYLDKNLQELAEYCRIPSVAAKKQSLDECADFTVELLRKRGFETEIIQTDGAPVVFAERKGKSDKTLVFYDHYDVQPEDPIELWDSPPFEAEIRDGKIYARGTADNKGNITNRLLAIDAILDEHDELPCNIKFVVEGEEEVGSVHLPEVLKNNTDKFSGDACIWEFGLVDHRGVPQQILGLRGICYVELSIQCLSSDVHSGVGGTIFPNAAWRLVWALSTLKDENENILIPGFYDNVVPPTERDRELISKLPDLSEDYRQRYGLKSFLNDIDNNVDLRVQGTFQPSCTICGITTGYQGPGSKTVLPAKASAKIDFRLVPNQTPEEVLEKLRIHLDSHGFEDIEIEYFGGGAAGRTNPDDPFVDLVVNTAEEIYGTPMDIVPMGGGSGPNHAFLKYLKFPVVSLGVGYPGSKGHAPNENIRLDLYVKCAKHITRIIQEFSK